MVLLLVLFSTNTSLQGHIFNRERGNACDIITILVNCLLEIKLVTSDNLCIHLPIRSSLVIVIENGQRSKVKGKHLKLWQSFKSANLSV